MIRNVALWFFTLVSIAGAATANAATFATSSVTAAPPKGSIGRDAGVDVSQGRYVRLTASGSITLSNYRACPRSTGPNGCPNAFSFARQAPQAPTGALLVAFTDKSGALLTAWSPAGDAAFVAIPQHAARMLLRINGTTGRETGRFRVAADVVSNAAADAAPVHRLGVLRSVAPSSVVTRATVQHLMRRVAFSASPATITSVYQNGWGPWLLSQLVPSSVDDSQLANYVQAVPVLTGDSSTDSQIYGTVPRRIVQREVATNRQVLEKVTLHWLEHFSVSENGVNDLGAMAHYEDTVRADALGNFQTLVSDVAKEPAMLFWLNNNYNDGSNPSAHPPNENFGRELMQLYTIGQNQLNSDGTTVDDSNGVPVQNYGEPDVKAIALALTGFEVRSPYPEPTGVDIRLLDTTNFVPAAHAHGPFTIINTQIIDPGDATIVDKVVSMLAHQPSAAPFEAKELLQRFATDDPSPGYVSRIAAVWSQNVDDANQIAKVISAIVNDPEFQADRGALLKEPVEYGVDAIRGLGAALDTPLSLSPTAFDSLGYDESLMAQPLYYPPTVFSFYLPGDKESLMSNSEILARWNTGLDIARRSSTAATCTGGTNACNFFVSLASLSGATPAKSAEYLCDALVDGGTPELKSLLENYLTPNSSNLSGAIWIVLSSPEYEVN